MRLIHKLGLTVAFMATSLAIDVRICSAEQSFTDIGAGLPGVPNCSLAWGDFDNDGDLDLALAGYIYRNDGGVFTDIGADLPGVDYCSLAWGDYDNDGDLDLALAGETSSWICRNDGGVFTDSGAGLPGVGVCSLAWGDYDNDGDLDLALAGFDANSNQISRIYRNDGDVFTDIGAGLTGVNGCSLAWGDYDNDGDLDLALAGYYNSGRISRIYRNDGGVFTDISAGLPGVGGCSLAWGDYGNDGDLDLALAGFDANSNPISRIYRNVGGTLNTAPAAPSGLTAAATGFGELTLNWNAASDSETPSAGLSYNVRVGTSPGAQDVFSGMADLSTGLRRIPATGNAQKRLSWTLESVPCGMVWWSVQAIDTAFAGSAWSVEQSVAMPSAVRVDFDGDCDVDSDDLDTFKSCASGPLIPHSGTTTCQTADLDEDNDVDQEDFAIFQRCISGKNNPADPNCAN